MRHSSRRLLLAVLMTATFSDSLVFAEEDGARAEAPVLIDSIHANNFFEHGLQPGVFSYHHLHGTRLAFEYLKSQGVGCEEIKQGRLTKERLARHKLLFINLPSAERPPFLISEIEAIRSFVGAGGSLMVFVDHTNAYFHAYRLQPLFEQLGLEIFTDTACDEPPNTIGSGNGWIAATRFTSHPVTRDLKCIAMQTGGRIDPRYAVALTSPQAWADKWSVGIFGEAESLGFVGNFELDEGEETGQFGIVAAAEIGAGRVIVIADQNMLGDVFLNYADNYRLWLNSIAWLLRDDSIRDAQAYRQWRTPRVMLHEQYDWATFGTRDSVEFYNAAAVIGRHWWTFIGDRLDEPCDLIVFAHNHCATTDEALDATARHLNSGKNVLVLYAPGDAVLDEEGVVGRILSRVNQPHSEKREEDGTLILELTSGAEIRLLGRQYIKFDNSYLPLPTEEPNEADEELIQTLLDCVEKALGE